MFKKIIYIILITYISYGSLKRPSLQPPPFEHFDKIIHFGAYLLIAFTGRLFPFKWRLSLALSIAIGLSLEIAQHFLPYRDFDLLDIVANTVGALMGIWIFQKFKFNSSE